MKTCIQELLDFWSWMATYYIESDYKPEKALFGIGV
jgi:hypothetical protein